jgi:hypothetical protein
VTVVIPVSVTVDASVSAIVDAPLSVILDTQVSAIVDAPVSVNASRVSRCFRNY